MTYSYQVGSNFRCPDLPWLILPQGIPRSSILLVISYEGKMTCLLETGVHNSYLSIVLWSSVMWGCCFSMTNIYQVSAADLNWCRIWAATVQPPVLLVEAVYDEYHLSQNANVFCYCQAAKLEVFLTEPSNLNVEINVTWRCNQHMAILGPLP